MTRYEFSYRPYRDLYLPTVPLLVKYKESDWLPATALIDSGAVLSLFQGEIARMLRIRLEEGKKIFPRGIGGHICAYIHKVNLRLGEEEFQADVAFSDELMAGVNLLGRKDVFEKFHVSFDEQSKKVVLETI